MVFSGEWIVPPSSFVTSARTTTPGTGRVAKKLAGGGLPYAVTESAASRFLAPHAR